MYLEGSKMYTNVLLTVVILLFSAFECTAAELIVEAKNKPADKQWKQFPTVTLDTIKGYKPYAAQIPLDKYGGRTDMKQKATGFFYPKKVADRWWLVDPDGNCSVH